MLVVLLLAMVYMLAFRKVGLSNFSSSSAEQDGASFFVDYNIVNVSRITAEFPSVYSIPRPRNPVQCVD